MLPGFSCRDLVAVLVKYYEEGAERGMVVCSAYLPYDSEEPPLSRELGDLVRYCEKENLHLLVGCDSVHIMPHGVAPTAVVEGKP